MYIEGLGSASIVNGVLRVETIYRNARGEEIPGGDLIIPANRVIPIADALQGLIAKIREQDAAKPAEVAAQ